MRRLFWDTDISEIDINKHTPYIIRRIIDYGDERNVKWLKKVFPTHTIIDVVKKSKGISRKSAYYWAIYYNIPEQEIECLKSCYPRELRPF